MSSLEALLAPLGDEAPAGPDRRESDEFAEIERAYHALAASQEGISVAGVDDEPEFTFEEVAELCNDFLQNQSKDLKVAVFLAASLLRTEGFSGFATGLEVIKGLLEKYWQDLHPAVSSRVSILDWFGSESFSGAVYLVPLTEFGEYAGPRGKAHGLADYKSWADEKEESKETGKGKAKSTKAESGEADEDGQDFGSGFGQTSWEWYNGVVSSLHSCNASLSALDALGKEKFAEADEKPPRYASLADALNRVTSAAEDLLGRKPPPPKPVEAPKPTAEGGTPGTGAAPTVISAEPANAEEAAALVAVAARVMRKESPWSPSPYLLLRGLRWGELRATGETLDPKALKAPTVAQRESLKTLFLDREWGALLEATEEIMATPAGRAWLDLQRYAVLAAERLGPDTQNVAAAIRSALAALLADIPNLIEASLMDDSPVASRDTMAWLQEEELLPAVGPHGDQPEEDKTRKAARIIRDASFERAAAMARAGDPEGAVDMLMERAEHESSQRARFIAKAEAAAIMVDHGMVPVARPILDELYTLIEDRQLESWETADVVAKPMGLLMRCLDQRDAQLRQKIYPRLAKLDPLLAMRVAATEGGASAPQSEAGNEGAPDG